MFKIKISFLCNFRPNLKFLNKKVQKKIFCKNFILFLMFINFNKIIFSSVFVKPKRKKRIVIPKAPHRFKLSKHTLCFSSYEILLVLNFNSINVLDVGFFKLSFLENLIILIKTITLILKKIDSSICTQKYISIFSNNFFLDEFFYKNYI